MKKVFEYRSYRTYFREWIALQPKGGRGIKLKMAKAAGCHSAYISFVLSDRADFSLEQIAKLTSMLGLNEQEQEYLFLLVQFERAGSREVKGFFQRKLDEIVEARRDLKNRLQYKKSLSREDQATYYSSWHYSVVHMLVAGEPYRTREAIASFLNLPSRLVGEILEFLTSIGVVAEVNGRHKIGTTSIHLEKNSPLISKHHTNWRLQAIQSLDHENRSDLHYSSVTMISEKDAEKIRATLVKAIEEVRATVKDSPEESCYAYCLDLFSLKTQRT